VGSTRRRFTDEYKSEGDDVDGVEQFGRPGLLE
jgi:hypothetical protein